MHSWMGKILLLVIGSLFALQSMAGDKPVFTENGVALRGYDTVAYFIQAKPVKGKKSFVANYQGAKWYFSSAAHQQLFKENPKKYAPQYGGHCAFAIANDKLVAVDPKAFTIVNDKLYLNYSLSVRKRWAKDIPGYIADGDENWAKL